MSLVLVVARPSGSASADPSSLDAVAAETGARTDVWRAARDGLMRATRARGADGGTGGGASAGIRAGGSAGTAPVAVVPGRLETLAAGFAAGDVDPSVAYAGSPDEAVEAVSRRIEEGAGTVAVVPVALAMDDAGGALRDPDLLDLHGRLEALARRHPDVELLYVGPPFDQAPALEAALAALRPPGSEEPALLVGAIERAFDGDLDRFGRFMSALQAGVPAGTQLVLRGSAVQGVSYTTGEPFDGRGPGTSDIDVVLIGEAAMAEWSPDAFYLAGVNTEPLYDGAPDIASPTLEHARAAAQEAARRPVALQAMARWFLDLRSGFQGTPYVVLAG